MVVCHHMVLGTLNMASNTAVSCIIHNHCILSQHLGSIARLSLLLVPALTSLVLPSKAITPFIAIHTQLVAQYTHLKFGHVSYTIICSAFKNW